MIMRMMINLFLRSILQPKLGHSISDNSSDLTHAAEDISQIVFNVRIYRQGLQ
jgi:hypothetical protein